MDIKSRTIITFPQNCTGCLICQLTCSFNYEEIFNPSLAKIIIRRSSKEGISYEIDYKADCRGCGLCAKSCPFGTLEIKEVKD